MATVTKVVQVLEPQTPSPIQQFAYYGFSDKKLAKMINANKSLLYVLYYIAQHEGKIIPLATSNLTPDKQTDMVAEALKKFDWLTFNWGALPKTLFFQCVDFFTEGELCYLCGYFKCFSKSLTALTSNDSDHGYLFSEMREALYNHFHTTQE